MNYIDANKLYPALASKGMEEARQIAVNSFPAFVKLIASYQVMGHCHEDLCRWIQEQDKEYKLILWPRDHGKSRYAAFYTVWRLVRDPSLSIIYASATSSLAEKMLEFIKTKILESKKFQSYFPNMINEETGRRAMWTQSKIIVDHPMRTLHGSSDPTYVTVGVGGNLTGNHGALVVLDDVVVYNNTVLEGETGRQKVNNWVGMLASILSAENDCLVVGTRYHPDDAYSMMIEAEYEIFDEETGEMMHTVPMYRVNQANVELDGQYLWPRAKAEDGKAYGFNDNIMSKKKAQYITSGIITQFYAQYYNDPNNRDSAPVSRDIFRYYDKSELNNSMGHWYVKGDLLTNYAALDLAATVGEKSDYTAITVGGLTLSNLKYLLDAQRIKTSKASEMVDLVEAMYTKWNFTALRIEAVGGFKVVAEDIKVQLEKRGIRVPIEIYNPGSQHKELRIMNILEPQYKAQNVFHFRGGTAELLEQELVDSNPTHDDLKDCWAMCIDPTFMKQRKVPKTKIRTNVLNFNKRFGGVDYGNLGKR